MPRLGPHNSHTPSGCVLQALHCHLFPGWIRSLSPALLSVTGSASSHTLYSDPTCLHFPFAGRWFRVFQMDLTPTYHDPAGERCVLIPCPLLLERKPSPSTESVPDSHNSPSLEHRASHLEADRLMKECGGEQENAGGTLYSAVDPLALQQTTTRGEKTYKAGKYFIQNNRNQLVT